MKWFLACALAALTVAVYAPVGGFDFVNLDDPRYVVDNAHVLEGPTVDGLRWSLSSLEEAAWQPVTWWSLMIDAAIGGAEPRSYHLTNVALHLLNVLLLFTTIAWTTRRTMRAAAVAALFAAHPLHVESVAWITARKDVLSTTFWLLAILAHVAWVRRRGAPRRVTVLVAATLALMAKPMAVTLPVTLLLIDVWPLGRLTDVGRRRAAVVLALVREKLSLFVLSGACGVVAVIAQRQGGALSTLEGIPLAIRTGNAILSYVLYLGDAFWPVGLAVMVPHPGRDLPWTAVGASLLLLAAVGFVAARRAGSAPWLAVGWTWYLITLLPVIGLVQFGVQARADRFTYVPMIGIYVAVVWGVSSLARRLRPVAVRRAAPVLLACAAMLALVVLARGQVASWRDSETLWRHALEVNNDNARAHNGLGMALNESGQLDRAVPHFRQAARIDPAYPEAYANLASALFLRGELDMAEDHFATALRLRPDRADWHADRATLWMQRGRLDDAIRGFERALRLDPDLTAAHNNLGVILARRGSWPGAIEHFEAVVRLDPDRVGARRNLERARKRAAVSN